MEACPLDRFPRWRWSALPKTRDLCPCELWSGDEDRVMNTQQPEQSFSRDPPLPSDWLLGLSRLRNPRCLRPLRGVLLRGPLVKSARENSGTRLPIHYHGRRPRTHPDHVWNGNRRHPRLRRHRRCWTLWLSQAAWASNRRVKTKRLSNGCVRWRRERGAWRRSVPARSCWRPPASCIIGV